jgi:hypothetical protein
MRNNPQASQELVNKLISEMSEEDKKKLEAVLADKEACQRILQSPEAQKLMKELGVK